jgi:hypothetical protein
MGHAGKKELAACLRVGLWSATSGGRLSVYALTDEPGVYSTPARRGTPPRWYCRRPQVIAPTNYGTIIQDYPSGGRPRNEKYHNSLKGLLKHSAVRHFVERLVDSGSRADRPREMRTGDGVKIACLKFTKLKVSQSNDWMLKTWGFEVGPVDIFCVSAPTRPATVRG